MQNASEEMSSTIHVLPKLFSLLIVNNLLEPRRGLTTIEREWATPPKLLISARELHLFLVRKRNFRVGQ